MSTGSEGSSSSRASQAQGRSSSATSAGARAVPVAGGAARQKRESVDILVVTDRADMRATVAAMLKPLGERLIHADSANDALRLLSTHDSAVILLDARLKAVNAFEMARSIKARERSASIPIIFLAADHTEDGQIARGYDAGAADFLTGPFQAGVVRARVAAFADVHRWHRRLRRQERGLREAEWREVELRQQTQLQESESRLAQLVALATDAIITMDDEAFIITLNQAAERMFGRIELEVRGEALTCLFADALNRDSLDRAAAIRGGITLLTGCRASGERFPAEASVSRLEVAGQVTRTLVVRDVSERRRVEEALRTQATSLATTTARLTTLNAELQRRQAELKHAMNARNRFYASMSHELRTPINAIIGYGTLLVDDIYGPLNERQRQGLERSNKAALHLLELVNDVLDLSKIEAGKIELSLQRVAFPGLLHDLFVSVRPMAEGHGSSLILESDCRTTVVTDPRRVRQILLNLLTNAIKFGGQSPITVGCAEWGDGGVEISVADGGAGIPPADLERIFDEFVQLPQRQVQEQGTGLGLAISRQLAQLLGGSLDVESVIDSGSVFRLRLPASADVLPE